MSNLRETVRTEMLADLPTRKSLKEEIRTEMLGPEIILFRNLRNLTFSELENLNCASGVSDYDRRICGVYGPQFGSRNDKHIVKNDDNVLAVAKDWYSSEKWKYFDDDGKICTETGAYLICDNGYLQLPTLLCPFMRSETNGPYESCYSANMESVRKDVECVFGILKARFGFLDTGFKHRRIQVCEWVFVACCVIHNMMLDKMRREPPAERLGRGCQMPDSGMWFSGPMELESLDKNPTTKEGKLLRHEFHRRRNILAKHVWWWNVKCKNGEIVPADDDGEHLDS